MIAIPQPAEEPVTLPVPSDTATAPPLPDLPVEDRLARLASAADSGDGEGKEAHTSPLHIEPVEEEPERKRFVSELLRLAVTPDGSFRPGSAVQITTSLRTSGLLRTLPPEEVKTLLAMLTFTTPNGDCLPTLPELAQAMAVSEGQARQRLERLMQFPWQGQPLAFLVPAESG